MCCWALSALHLMNASRASSATACALQRLAPWVLPALDHHR
ncbi:hypothetical protein XCV1212 [Xanthomonas euvesicatoria pv. vesicatoria str. 85-10]|uniref:Secreted protein n=1 Tax=Xanthomonas euvesicatoria pv. vesicatoria (strain 85-10) TaxID=316273 RepID=Q3BWC0_XANE5|nr:hypothetical protein XCV1212 [Xanthomonas euvesicatoria pv. vesicatoria str. 85-10]